MLSRLGNVLYWIGCIVGLICVAIALLGAVAANESTANRITIAVLAGVVGLVAWLIGWACRYVLAGR